MPENLNSGAPPSCWRVNDPRALDRAQGCLLGQLAGDALGALVEFQSKAEIAHLYPGGLHQLAAGGPWKIIAGQPTDDSEMAVALARTLIRDQDHYPERVFEAYVRWCASGPFDIGTTTLSALRAPFRDRRRSSNSQANGSLMRISPIGIFAAGDPQRAADLARVDSALTHPHPVCVSACAAFAAAIAVGIAGGSRVAMLDIANEHAGLDVEADSVREALQAACTSPPADFQQQMGWVLIALQNAFHHLSRGHDLQRAVSTTVVEGGDTDTNGAIVGALIGAADGHARAPEQWATIIASCRPAPAPGTAHPRPEEYWPSEYKSLARQLLATGVARSTRLASAGDFE